ncbi:MAG: dynamin family protein [Bacillota bacterium]
MSKVLNQIDEYVDKNNLDQSEYIKNHKLTFKYKNNYWESKDIYLYSSYLFIVGSSDIKHFKISEFNEINLDKEKNKLIININKSKSIILMDKNIIEFYNYFSFIFYKKDSDEFKAKKEILINKYCRINEVLIQDINNEISKLYDDYKYYNVVIFEIELYLEFGYDLIAAELLIKNIENLFFYRSLDLFFILFENFWTKSSINMLYNLETENSTLKKMINILYEYNIENKFDEKKLISVIINLINEESLFLREFLFVILYLLIMINKKFKINDFKNIIEKEFRNIISKSKINQSKDRVEFIKSISKETLDNIDIDILNTFELYDDISNLYIFEEYYKVIEKSFQKNRIIDIKKYNKNYYYLDEIHKYLSSLINFFYKKNFNIKIINKNYMIYIKEISKYSTILEKPLNFLLQSEINLINKDYKSALKLIKKFENNNKTSLLDLRFNYSNKKYQILKAWSYKSIKALEELSKLVSKKHIDIIDYAINQLFNEVKYAKIPVNSIIKRLADLSDITNNNKIKEIKNSILKYDSINKINVGIVGETSTGKSTFINRFMNTNIFYSTEEEATGIPTIISNANNYLIEIFDKNNDKVLLYFKNDVVIKEEYKKFIEFNKNENILFHPDIDQTLKKRIKDINFDKFLVEFTKKHSSNKLIEKVKIKGPFDNIANKYNFIDTPGLNASDNQEIRTLNMISSCEIVFYLIDGKFPLKKEEIKKLEYISGKVVKIFLLVNKMDLVIKGNPFDSKESIEKSLLSRLKKLTNNIENIEIIFISSKINIENKYKNYYNNLLSIWDRLEDTHKTLFESIKEKHINEILNKNSKILYYDVLNKYNNIKTYFPIKKPKKQILYIINNKKELSFYKWKYNVLYNEFFEIIKKYFDEEINRIEFDRIFDKGSIDLEENLNRFFENDFRNRVKNINKSINKLVNYTFKENFLPDINKNILEFLESKIIINLDFEKFVKSNNKANIEAKNTNKTSYISAGLGAGIGSILGPLGFIAGGIIGSIFSDKSEEIKIEVIENYNEFLKKEYNKLISKSNFNRYFNSLEKDIEVKLNEEFNKKYNYQENKQNREMKNEKEIYEIINIL